MITRIFRTAALSIFLAPGLFAQSFCWSESTDNQTIATGTGVVCAYGAPAYFVASNGLWRRYNPQSRGMNADFYITKVTFAVEQSLAGFGFPSQPATINIWRDTTPGDPAPMAGLTLLGSQPIEIPNLTSQFLPIVLSSPLLCASNGANDIVLDLEIPDGFAAQNTFFWGGNQLGESSPTYLSSISCGLLEPNTLASIGFAGRTMIFDLCGNQVSQVPQVYCTAKVNSFGCTPSIGATGMSSATIKSGFIVTTNNVISHQIGLYLYGISGRAAMPLSGGLLCVGSPLRRSLPLNSHGNPLPKDCSGRYVLDFNTYGVGALGGSPAPFLMAPGNVVQAQAWGRDNGFSFPDNASLSDALEWMVGP